MRMALAKGYLMGESLKKLEALGYRMPAEKERGRRLTFSDADSKIKFMIIRPTDVPVYVERGGADLGIVGKDVLEETGASVVELLDLGFGPCRLVFAVPEKSRLRTLADVPAHLKIATKFPQSAARFFAGRGLSVELVKLYGSVELAPQMGLADGIVDLVATGETLRAHGLRVVTELLRSTARLVANRVSWKTHFDSIYRLQQQLAAGWEGGHS